MSLFKKIANAARRANGNYFDRVEKSNIPVCANCEYYAKYEGDHGMCKKRYYCFESYDDVQKLTCSDFSQNLYNTPLI